MANKVRLNIGGSDYFVTTEENPHYTVKLSYRLDAQIKELMESSPSMTLTTALVLCAMSYLDDANKANQCADNFRGQIKEYLEEAAKARIELNDARREIQRLKKKCGEI